MGIRAIRELVREQGVVGTCAAFTANMLLRGSSALARHAVRNYGPGVRRRVLSATATIADRAATMLCDAFNPEGS